MSRCRADCQPPYCQCELPEGHTGMHSAEGGAKRWPIPALPALLTEYRLAHTAEAIAQPTEALAVAAGLADERRRDAADAALLAYLVAQESL